MFSRIFYNYTSNIFALLSLSSKKLLIIPTKMPIKLPKIRIRGNKVITAISFIRNAATNTCPILCAAAPATLMPTMLKISYFTLYKPAITAVLNTPPAQLNKKTIKPPPPKIEASMVLIMTTIKASLKLKNIITISVIIFASPSFTPGTGMGIDIQDSIIDKTKACDIKSDNQN